MKAFNIGSIVSFGGYDWRILDIQDNAVLIITDCMIEQRTYNNYAGGGFGHQDVTIEEPYISTATAI